MKKAVLFLTFNRLDVVQKAFEQIKLAKPPRFYVASDGARQGVEGEKEKVEQVRKWILDNIDWDCEVKTKFNETNFGCGKGVSSAITWFFENEEDGIILEDDCVANQSFFAFCEELLDKYKDDKRVWHISGDGFCDDKNAKESYYFAKIMHCWGWASWADRWKHFKLDLKDYDEKYLKNLSNRKEVQKYWFDILHRMKNFEIDTWDYQWTFLIVAYNGFCINPYENLVSNIGTVGVHYSADNPLLNMKTYEIDRVVHPEKVEFNQKAVVEIYKNHFGIKEDKMKFIKKEKNGNMRKITILGFIKISYKKNNEKENVIEQIKPIEPLKNAKCRICGGQANLVFGAKVLQEKYDAEYYFCKNCGFLQVNDPTWLDEAYKTPVTVEDTGVLLRNVLFQKFISIILYNFFGKDGKYLDYGGGYGFLTRFMRDIGFDFYHNDKYCTNITAIGFEGDLEGKYTAVTSLETFEHFLNPIDEIEKMLKITDTIIFSEDLLPYPVPYPDKWWYYAPMHGQHIGFYSKETIDFIAKRYDMNYYNIYNLHILTKQNFDNAVKHILKTDMDVLFNECKNNLSCKAMDDMNYIIKTKENK